MGCRLQLGQRKQSEGSMSVAGTAKAGTALGGLIIGSTLLVGLVLLASHHFGAQAHLERLFVWIESLGLWGLAFYLILHALVIVFLLPGVFFTLGAGFLFGVLKGSLLIVTATTLGAGIAFGISRLLLHERAKHFLLSHAKARVITAAISTDGWKVILLSRLIPFFPFKASNYIFGLMNFRLRDFLAGTFIGVIPWSVTNVYIGWLAGDLAAASATNRVRTPLEWGLYVGGLVIAVGFVVYVGRRAQRALRELENGNGDTAAASASTGPIL